MEKALRTAIRRFVPSGKFICSKIDLLVLVFLLYVVANYHLHQAIAVDPLRAIGLCGVGYFGVRFLLSWYPVLLKWAVAAILLNGSYEAFLGLRQLYGFAHSNHSLFALTGTFFNPGPMGGYVAVCLVMAVVTLVNGYSHQNQLFRTSVQRKTCRPLLKIDTLLFVVAFFTSILTLLVLPATLSRAGWLAALLALLLFVYRVDHWADRLKRFAERRKRLFLSLLLLMIVAVSGVFYGVYVFKRGSADGRLLMWKISANTLAEHPVTGVGVGYFCGAYGERQAAYFETQERTPSEVNVAGCPEYGFNEYLQLGVELGWVGLLLFFGIVLSVLWRLWTKQKSQVLYGLLALLVFACFSYPFSLPAFVVILLLCLGAGGDGELLLGRRLNRYCAVVLFVCTIFLGVRLGRAEYQYRQSCLTWESVRLIYRMQIYDRLDADYAPLYSSLKNNAAFLFEYGHTLNKQGLHYSSNFMLQRGAQLSSDPMFYNILGNNYLALSQFSEAEACYWRAFYMVPHRIYPLYLLVKLYLSMNEKAKAYAMAQRVVDFVPKVSSPATQEIQTEMSEFLAGRE